MQFALTYQKKKTMSMVSKTNEPQTHVFFLVFNLFFVFLFISLQQIGKEAYVCDRPPIRYVYNRKGKRNILPPGS